MKGFIIAPGAPRVAPAGPEPAYTAGMWPPHPGLIGLLIAVLVATGWAFPPDDDGVLPGLSDGADDQALPAPSLDPVPLATTARLAVDQGHGRLVPIPTRTLQPRPAPRSGRIPRAPPAA